MPFLLQRTASLVTGITYANIVVQLNSSCRVKLYLFQGLSYNIVGLPLTLLGGFYSGGFINISFLIYIELTECILKSENFVLLKLGIFPAQLRKRVSK
jgi:hypothetical protein